MTVCNTLNSDRLTSSARTEQHEETSAVVLWESSAGNREVALGSKPAKKSAIPIRSLNTTILCNDIKIMLCSYLDMSIFTKLNAVNNILIKK